MIKIDMNADYYHLLIDVLKENRNVTQDPKEKAQTEKLIWLLTNAVANPNEDGEHIYSTEWFQSTLNILMQNMLVALNRSRNDKNR